MGSFARATLLVAFACSVQAGPLEFGLNEVERALIERRLTGRKLRIRTELSQAEPETFRITGNVVSGGDLRGLMYGLLTAAEQIRARGYLAAVSGGPAVPIRGVRKFLHNADLEKDWYYSRDYWTAYIRMLARNRFNRLNLVFAHQTHYLAPPYPFWVEVEQFPQIRARGVTQQQQDRNLEMLRFISQTAADHAIDFTLGIWEHNIQPGMTPTVDGLTRENIGPYSYAALRKVLAACPAIRSVQMRTNSESGIPPEQQVEFYRNYVYRAIRETGRLVKLDLRGWLMSDGMLEAATGAGVPLRLSSKYWAEHLGRPYQPPETFRHYSYINFLKKPRPYEFYWEIWALGSNRLLLWGDPEHVRRTVSTLTLSGTKGFEIDEPLAQKGFGNRAGKWGVFTPAHQDRVFWKYEFERYWLFYLLWGRVSFDPKTSEKLWMGELERRFGKASLDVLTAYSQASRVLSELSAAHMPDPNMYVWPEINPGGAIDVYKDVLPSDRRFIASISEAVTNRIRGIASAKQTAWDTARLFAQLAQAIEEAAGRAEAKLGSSHVEWRGSEPDFLVLAALARYHSHKHAAADQLTYFYETARPQALEAAKAELASALAVWEKLVEMTDGLYPAEMAFGPADFGHWKDKLPYVRHDLKIVEEREALFNRFGRFDAGFDFGAKPPEARGADYRTLPSLVNSTLEPRFQLVTSDTLFDHERGFGWVGEGKREARAMPHVPYEVLRANQKAPERLPGNALFGDSIRGSGPQTFRVRAADGEYTVSFLHPSGSADASLVKAENGVLDIVLPQRDWEVSGLIIKKNGNPEPPPASQREPVRGPRPVLSHVAPKRVHPGNPLTLRLGVAQAGPGWSVRLHYRPLNHLAEFRSPEAPATRATFTIPGDHIAPQWDLLYYFEVLNAVRTGWFHPDPAQTTPYFVVEVTDAPAPRSGK